MTGASKIPPFLFSPLGRLSRRWFFLTWLASTFAIVILIYIKRQVSIPFGWISHLSALFVFSPLVPKCVAAARRCHDIGLSGWFALPSASLLIFFALTSLGLFINIDHRIVASGYAFMIMLAADLILSIIPGTKGPNRYGPATREPLTPTEPDVF